MSVLQQMPARGSIMSSVPLISDRISQELEELSPEVDDSRPTSKVVKDPYVEGNLKFIDPVKSIIEFQRDVPVMCVRFNLDGSILAAGLANGVIKVLDVETFTVHYSLFSEDEQQSYKPVTSLKFVPAPDDAKPEHKHLLLASYASGLLRLWHYPSSSCLYTIDEGRQTLAFAFCPTGNSFITSGADTELKLYDFETKQNIRTLMPSDSRTVMNGHRARVFAVIYHQHEPHEFISGGWDNTVQFWDDRVKHSLRSLYGPHICGDALDIDPIHNHILTGSWRKPSVLQIWDYGAGTRIKDVPQDHLHGSLLYCAQWLGKEHIICGGCEQNMVRVIDRGTLNTVGQLVDLPKGVYSIDHTRQMARPNIAIASSTKAYLCRMEKRQ